jgi:UDP-N-acetylmuramyl tripeptide synthase
MHAFDRLLIAKTSVLSRLIKALRLGAGATWPGEIALTIRPAIASYLGNELHEGSILIAGTNGKTTTSLMIAQLLKSRGSTIVHNVSGANLLNGVVSSFIADADLLGRVDADWGVFEVDENSVPIVLRYMTPKVVVLLNLFRDQLDRYGEVDVIVEKWEKALAHLPSDTVFVLNSDDPGVAYLGTKLKGKKIYFGVTDTKKFLDTPEHATDSTFCPRCGVRLLYKGTFYSHIGHWQCPSCKLARPTPAVDTFPSALPGLYNYYNTLAAVAAGKALGLSESDMKKVLKKFVPAFGRQESFAVDGRNVRIFLSKNPAGFNATIRTVREENASHIAILLNDRIPDGRDVSWIWDVDFEAIPKESALWVGGDRIFDMALRVRYAGHTVPDAHVEPDLSALISRAISETPRGSSLFILATYSAMLDVRKLLKGRKIL